MILLSALAMLLLTASGALAEAVFTAPPVPAGLSPFQTWILTILGGLLTTFVPIAFLWARNALAQTTQAQVQTTKARADMINGSVVNAAHLVAPDMAAQGLTPAEVSIGSPLMSKALDYVTASHPEAILATAEASQQHLADQVKAELNKIAPSQPASDVPPLPVRAMSPLPPGNIIQPYSKA